MPAERKLKVFLCHASQDKPIVLDLYQRLLAEGWIDPWLDKEKLLPGQDWGLEIEKAVETADAVIVCLSSSSVTKEGYIQKELRTVLEVALEKPEETIFIIPVRLDGCEVPRRLRALQYVDYFWDNRQDAYQRLIQSLKVRFGEFHPEQDHDDKKGIPNKSVEKVKYYFVGHQLTEENVKDLRMFIENVFLPKGWKPYYAEREFGSQPILLKICQKLYFTDIGIFDLSTPNANVYMELGIALAFNKKIIVIARDGISMPPALLGLPVIYYKSYTDLTQKLEESFDALSREKSNFIDFCVYCGKICEGMTVYPDRNTYLFMEKRGLLSRGEWDDIKSVFEPYLQKRNLQSVSLRGADAQSLLCNIRKKVRTTQFSIAHLGNLAEPDSYIALGMCIGYCRPWFLISRADEDNRENTVPSNLLGLDRLQYSSLDDLRDRLESDMPGFLDLLFPLPTSADEQTASIEREKFPFWLLLVEWLEKKRATHIAGVGKGMLRLVQIGNYGFLDKFLITRRGVELGRDLSCDIVIAHNHISTRHARIYEQDGACYLQDLNSRNGTYYNGQRLLPRATVRIGRGDRIRLAHAERYLVWDDTLLPTDSYFLQICIPIRIHCHPFTYFSAINT
ncbi:MAG TPA: TIR domain-containing protein, partial [Anaerolineales bacterium]|nr:TIR domain-containing protein [Anaerolineales bacterium]